MTAAAVEKFRNIAFVGHAASGKTTLGEAILHRAGHSSRLGSVDDGTSQLDYDDESRERKHSCDSSFFHIAHEGHELNILDTPGMPDYSGLAMAALMGVETAAVCVSAATGIGINTRRMFNAAKALGLARMIVITRIDAENVRLEDIYAAVKQTFGPECHAINLPAGGGKSVVDVWNNAEGTADILDVAKSHTELLDAIVETDDSLMEEYMSTGTVDHARLQPAIGKAVASGHVVPVLFTAARNGVGIDELLHALVEFAPSPLDGKHRELVVGEGDSAARTVIEPRPDGDFIAQVFKITTDPKSNIKYSLARVHSGTLTPEGQVFVSGDRKGQRPGHFLKLRGAHQDEVPAATAGDIVAFAKLDFKIGNVLFSKPGDGIIEQPRYPTPMQSLAIEPKSRGDIEKIGGALHRFEDEDPCFRAHRDPDTGEMVISGLGELHLNVVMHKMKRYFKVDVATHPPRIPYRETIAGSAKYVEYTHKKQTGGAGQFARVFIDLEPNERGKGYEFIDKIFGGVIDQAFRPSVDKGVQAVMKRGIIAGCPVVDVKVSLVDGKTHPVDSKDIAFQVAGREAFKKAFMMAKPILLEPIVTIDVTVPAANVGDITRDISGKRGQVLGQEMLPGDMASIRGQVPLAEVANYGSQLKSVTGGQGSFVMEFSHYDMVPPNVQQQIMANYKAKPEEEE